LRSTRGLHIYDDLADHLLDARDRFTLSGCQLGQRRELGAQTDVFGVFW
jgi:hypothetical protein